MHVRFTSQYLIQKKFENLKDNNEQKIKKWAKKTKMIQKRKIWAKKGKNQPKTTKRKKKEKN